MTGLPPETAPEPLTAGAPPPAPSSWRRRLEDAFCGVLMITLIGAGLLGVLRRFAVRLPVVGDWVMGVSLGWPEPLSRHLVLWVALFGAGVAAADRSHIAIDALSYVLSPRARRVAGVFTNLVTAVLCAVFAWLAVGFAASEFQNNPTDVTFFGLHSCWLTLVLPVGFALLALRSLWTLGGDAWALLQARAGKRPAA